MGITRRQKTNITKVFKRITDAIDAAVTPKELRPTADFTVGLIVKRTRLGYGVAQQFGTKSRLKSLSKDYIEHRQFLKSRDFLSEETSPKRSNLTLTGQMLGSMRVISAKNGKVVIGPFGNRFDTRASNPEIAAKQERMGRIFNRVSALEYNQILRFYRRSFGDLLRRKRLLI